MKGVKTHLSVREVVFEGYRGGGGGDEGANEGDSMGAIIPKILSESEICLCHGLEGNACI